LAVASSKTAAKNSEKIKNRMEELDDKQKKAVHFISEHAFSQSEENIRWMEKLLSFLKEIEN